MHDDIGDGVEAARRQVLGSGDEIAGGVVDEAGERAIAENLLDHRFDRGGVADVDAVACDASAMRLHKLGGGRVADALAPAADRDLGAEAEELLGHRLAEPRAAAGDEDFLAPKKAVDEHQGFLSRLAFHDRARKRQSNRSHRYALRGRSESAA